MKTFIDLFAGCGGLSLGFQRAGWQLQFAVEAHADAFATYRENLILRKNKKVNWPRWLKQEAHDVVELIASHRDQLTQLKGKVELVVGGPPCQGFSTNGKRRHDDPRNQMVISYLELISLLSPRMVLLENVRGFTSMLYSKSETFAIFVARELDRLGYDTWSQLISASEWGVPQRRPRFFLIAVKKETLFGVDPFQRLRTVRKSFLKSRGISYDELTKASDALDDLRTEGKVLVPDPEFGDRGFRCLKYREPKNLSKYAQWIRSDSNGQPSDIRLPRHSKAVVDRFASILETCPSGRSISPANRLRLGTKKRSTTPMSADLPSPTITTLPDDLIHYSEPRILTVREHARLQSFPDSFRFQGPYTSGGPGRKTSCPRYTQVGNAVPPLLAEAIAEMLANLLAPLSYEQQPKCTNVLEMNRHVLA
jgi:DNA (cytosine-5)-methyltransferase 1